VATGGATEEETAGGTEAVTRTGGVGSALGVPAIDKDGPRSTLTASDDADVGADTAPSSTLTVPVSTAVGGVGDGSVVDAPASPVAPGALTGAGVSAVTVAEVGSAYTDSPGAVALADSTVESVEGGATAVPARTAASAPASPSLWVVSVPLAAAARPRSVSPVLEGPVIILVSVVSVDVSEAVGGQRTLWNRRVRHAQVGRLDDSCPLVYTSVEQAKIYLLTWLHQRLPVLTEVALGVLRQ